MKITGFTDAGPGGYCVTITYSPYDTTKMREPFLWPVRFHDDKTEVLLQRRPQFKGNPKEGGQLVLTVTPGDVIIYGQQRWSRDAPLSPFYATIGGDSYTLCEEAEAREFWYSNPWQWKAIADPAGALNEALDEFCASGPQDPLMVVDIVATLTVGALDRRAEATGADLLGADLRAARRILGLVSSAVVERSLRGEEAEDE